MPNVEAICLGHKETITGKYETIEELKSAIAAKFPKHLQKLIGSGPVDFTLTYYEQSDTSQNSWFGKIKRSANSISTVPDEKRLDTTDVIKRYRDKTLTIYVKRIWDSCCSCMSPFGIVSECLPYECPATDCGYQYCARCVDRMRKITPQNKEIYCMYCMKSSMHGPQQNQFISDLLWKTYENKYGADLTFKSGLCGVRSLNSDIECRTVHLQFLTHVLQRNLTDTSSAIKEFTTSIQNATDLVKQLKQIKSKAENLPASKIGVRDFDAKLEICFQEFVQILTGNAAPHARKCEQFIRVCEQLLYFNQQAMFRKYFPSLSLKMDEWEERFEKNQDHHPKVIDAFRAVEGDLGLHVFPSIPCRVGVIGNISVGKSSLINRLREIFYKALAHGNNAFDSPVRVDKSTYCRLEFESELPDEKRVILVDIEGSTDTDRNLSLANYFSEITKADCDLYIIVFDNQFTDVQHSWKRFIEEGLHRQCWLVRSKVDQLFRAIFKQYEGHEFSTSDCLQSELGEEIFDEIRSQITKDIHGTSLSNVYAVFASRDQDMLQLPNAKGDFTKLAYDISRLPIDMYRQRLQSMTRNAMALVINNCFRRAAVVSIIKHQIAAGAAAIIPFGDLLIRYISREGIRQDYGVNDHSCLATKISTSATNEFQDYLKKFEITVEELELKTSAFNNVVHKRPAENSSTLANLGACISKSATGVAIAGVSVSDDILRATGVVAVNAARGLSIAFIAVGAVATAGLCVWAGVSNGRQTYNYLNRLCDDLIIVSYYVAGKLIEVGSHTRRSFVEEKPIN